MSNTETNKKTKTPKTKKSNSKNEEVQKNLEDFHEDETKVDKEEISNNIILEKETVLQNDVEEILDDKSSDVQKDELSEKDDSSDKEEYIKRLDTVIECLSFINDKNLKDINLTKDFFSNVVVKCKKIIKLNTQMTTNTMDLMTKENLVSLKHKDLKQSKPKKVINKENLAINKQMPTYPEVLKFLKLEDNSTISRAQLIQSINAFVKKEKTDNNPDIYVKGDNRCFNLIGELKVLFDFIKLKMLERGDLENESEFPTNISYRQIMKYLKYCFTEIKK